VIINNEGGVTPVVISTYKAWFHCGYLVFVFLVKPAEYCFFRAFFMPKYFLKIMFMKGDYYANTFQKCIGG